jgi:hypothetical protein
MVAFANLLRNLAMLEYGQIKNCKAKCAKRDAYHETGAEA